MKTLLKIREKKILLCLMIVLSCWLVEATSQLHHNTTLSVHSRQKRAAKRCDVGLAGLKAFFAIVSIVAGAGPITAVFGEYAPLAVAASSSVGSSASADVSAINCKKEPRLDTILANQKQLKKNLKEIKELVMENGRSIEKVEEKVEFNTIVGMYGNEIISLRTAEKAFLKNLRFDRDGAIEESPAQRRFMNTALGHQPGSQFRGLAALNDMITKGVGITTGRIGESIYSAARKTQHIFCRPSVKKYFNNLILEGANILFAAKAMNGEEITDAMKKIYQDYISDNERLFKKDCEQGNIGKGGNKWCGEHYATSCDKCGGNGREEACSGGTRPDGRINHIVRRGRKTFCTSELSFINCGDCGWGYLQKGRGEKIWSCRAMNKATYIDFDEDHGLDIFASFASQLEEVAIRAVQAQG